MSKTKAKLSKPNRLIPLDESGNLVMFTIPYAALWYGMYCVKLRDQDKIDDCMDELANLHYSIPEN